MRKETVGTLQMLACAALWSIAGVLFKFIPWHGMVIAALRALIAGAVVFLYLRAKGMRFLVNRKTVPAGVSKGLTCVLFALANKMTTAANAIVLQFTAPVFLLVFSAAMFHRRFRRGDVLAVLLTMGGISLFFLDRLDRGAFLGNLVALAAGVSMGVMYMLMGEVNEEERLSSVLVGELFTVLLGLPFLFLTPPELSARPVLFILILGVFQLGVPYILYALAAGKCPPLACCLLAALEPLLNPVWVLLFYGERPGPFALAGGAAVILTVTVWSLWSHRHPEEERRVKVL